MNYSLLISISILNFSTLFMTSRYNSSYYSSKQNSSIEIRNGKVVSFQENSDTLTTLPNDQVLEKSIIVKKNKQGVIEKKEVDITNGEASINEEKFQTIQQYYDSKHRNRRRHQLTVTSQNSDENLDYD